MLVIRPVRAADLPALLDLAGLTSFGLTTLPKDSGFLRGRIRDSEDGFGRLDIGRPRGESYLFVMEETTTGRVVGTSGIVSKVGGFEPFYAYRSVGVLERAARCRWPASSSWRSTPTASTPP
jgi:arginine N-succinyltransferase